MRRATLTVVRFYRRFISPFTPPACRFTPSCSAYAEESIVKRGVVRGILRTAWRLLRCHPLSRGGYDPA